MMIFIFLATDDKYLFAKPNTLLFLAAVRLIYVPNFKLGVIIFQMEVCVVVLKVCIAKTVCVG